MEDVGIEKLLRPLIKAVLSEALPELLKQELLRDVLDGRIAYTEPEAAKKLGLNPWQLRDIRLANKIGHTRIVGKRVRYLPADLIAYLQTHHQPSRAS